jgi:PIN domain nuclease of toxin-antitoxin system
VIVLDSSALLAVLFFEPGCERVAELVTQSCMATVNLAEVLGRLARVWTKRSIAWKKWASFGSTSTASWRLASSAERCAAPA